MSDKKIFEKGDYGVAGDTEARTDMKGVNPDLVGSDKGDNGFQKLDYSKPDPTPTAPAPVQKDPPAVPKSKPKAPVPTTDDPAPATGGDPKMGLAGLPWKQIAIVAGAAALIAALVALFKGASKSIKLRFNKSVRTLARMQKDFTMNKKGLDMRAVLPGVGSKLNDFFTRVFSGFAFMHNSDKGIMNNKSAQKLKSGVIGLYPFCDMYEEEINNDYKMAQKVFSNIAAAGEELKHNNVSSKSDESFNGKVYQSFAEAFGAGQLNESKAENMNESVMALAALAPMVIRGGMYVVNKYKDGKKEKGGEVTVQVTKQSTREMCYAIMNNFFEKYISFEQVSKKMGVDIQGLSDIDKSSIDKMRQVVKAYSNPNGASVVKQYKRMKDAYDKMCKHYFNIGDGIIVNFKKYTKADDEKHENLLVAANEKLQAMWDQQKDQYDNLFPYVLNEIISHSSYQAYIDFILESVLPVFASGIAGDADYVLDVMPKKGDYFLLQQTNQADNNIGNKVVCKITQDFNSEDKSIGMTLIALYKGNPTFEADGTCTLDTDPENFDRKAYKKEPVTLPYNKFMALDPHQVTNMEEVIKKDIRFDIGAYVDKDIIAMKEGVQPFEKELNAMQINGITAVVYKIVKAEGSNITYKIEYVSTDRDIEGKLRYDEENNIYKANAEDFQAIPEESRKEGNIDLESIDGNHKPVMFSESVKNLDPRTKITFEVEQDNHKVQYEGFIEQTDDKQVLHLKGTLTVEGEEKEKNDEKDRESTVSKIALLRISKDTDAQEIIDYLTDKYSAKFEKQEGTGFSDNIKKEEKTPGNMSQTQSRDIGEPDDVYTNITDLTDEILTLYQSQTNKGNGSTDMNPFLMNYWLYTNIKGANFYFVPTMENPSNKDKNPKLNSIIVKCVSSSPDVYGKISVDTDAESVSKQMKNIGVEKLSLDTLFSIDNDTLSDDRKLEHSRMISAIRKVKDTDIKTTTEMPKNEDELKKFLETLFAFSTGKNRDEKSIRDYLFTLLVNLGENTNLNYDKNSKPKQEQSQQGQPQSNPSTSSKGNTDEPSPVIELDPHVTKVSSSTESVNEDNEIMGHNTQDKINKDLENKNIKPNVIKDPSGEKDEYDGSKTEVSENKLTLTCGKLFYDDTDGNQQHVKIEFEFCLSPLWKQGEYKPTAVIKNIYNNQSCSFPWPIDYSKVATILYKSFGEMNIYLGEEQKKESLNDAVKETFNFNVSYTASVSESDNTSIILRREISCDGDCSDYYMLSESVWGDGNVKDPKATLYQSMRKLFNTCRDKSSLMEYAKASQNVQFGKYAQTVTYDVPKSHGFTGNDGCPLYECCVALKFNSKDSISDAINLGVYKISF